MDYLIKKRITFFLTFIFFFPIFIYGFGFTNNPSPCVKAGKLMKFIVQAEADNIMDTLQIHSSSLPKDAVLISVENCKKCRSKKWQFIFYWHTLPYDQGDYKTVFYLKDNDENKDTLTVQYKVK